jgi:hypothetical protein
MLPNWYKEWIPRVSNIISFISPFEWTENERRYLEWLYKNNINQKEYLEASQELWTFVHLQLENYINQIDIDTDNPLYKETQSEIKHWIKLIDTIYWIETEVYIKEKNDHFQWSCDLIYEDNDWNKILWDWKTWGINKSRFWLPNKFIVAPDKKKKVQLQLSFYAYWLRQQWTVIDKIQLLFLHKEGLKTVDLEILPDEVIENYLALYEASLLNKDIKILLPNNETMFEIEILIPTEQYGNIKIRSDLSKIDNWKTANENLTDLITTAKYARQIYLQD